MTWDYEKRNKVAKFRFAMIAIGTLVLACWFGFISKVEPIVGKVDECYSTNNPDHGQRFLCDFVTDDGMKSISFRRIAWKEYRGKVGQIVTIPGRVQHIPLIMALCFLGISMLSLYLSIQRVLTPPFIGWVTSRD